MNTKIEDLKVIESEFKPSKLSIELFARAIYGKIKTYYENPENMAKFKKWQAKQGGNNEKVEDNTGADAGVDARNGG